MTRPPGAWLTEGMRSRIKRVLESQHGVVPTDDEINWISTAEENGARIRYESRIIRRLETRLVRRSQTTDHTHRASSLLMEASGCYREGYFDACILLARAAVEVALQTAVGREKGSLDELISKAGLDKETTEMAHALRRIGNGFAHYKHEDILGLAEVQVDPVIFVGDQPSDSDRPAQETSIKVDTVAGSLAYTAYRYAVSICEKVIPQRQSAPASPK